MDVSSRVAGAGTRLRQEEGGNICIMDFRIMTTDDDFAIGGLMDAVS